MPVSSRSPVLKSRARALRRTMTDAERCLWRHLRNKQLINCKFRRQQPIGRYIVDFVCIQQRLIIELDGGQHAEQQHYDQQRTVFLQQQGYRVLRFWNNDVLQQTDAVLQAVAAALV